jgi:muramidase (phage lysozyme)
LPFCTWGPESGGSYTARNPVSTAAGKYQILDTTWHGFGGPDYPGSHDAAQAPPWLQEKIARRVLAGQGLNAWVNC